MANSGTGSHESAAAPLYVPGYTYAVRDEREEFARAAYLFPNNGNFLRPFPLHGAQRARRRLFRLTRNFPMQL